MQLLLKRGQSPSGATFDLWAQFQLSPEEQALIDKYQVRNTILAEGDAQRDLTRSARYAAAVAVALGILVVWKAGLSAGLFLGCLAFAGLTFFIYQQIREEIRVSDILAGRSFTCRSVLTLIEKERTITEMAAAFRQFLEAMQTWGGTDTIAIEPGAPPRLRVIEPPHAAA